MSNGALAAVALANQVRIAAIVSLDGTIGERAAARVLPELPSAATPATVPPLVHLCAPESAYLDFSELRKRPGRMPHDPGEFSLDARDRALGLTAAVRRPVTAT
jgi:hypothetical protein